MNRNRINQPKSPRFPSAEGNQIEFNLAVVEILKQEYRERTALNKRITELEDRIQVLERKNREGSRPPLRYNFITEDLN
jgi:hypothetical protein